MNGPVHLVLHGLKEQLSHLRPRVVIHARLVNVANLPVKIPLRNPDFPDAPEQFVVILVFRAALLQPLVVQGKALDDVFAQTLGGPDAELRASMRLHPVADGNNDVQVVKPCLVLLAISGSC